MPKSRRDDLLLELFAGLISHPPWHSFLKRLKQYLDCERCALLVRAPTESDSGLMVSENIGSQEPAEIFAAYRDSPFHGIPDGEVAILSQMMSEEEFRQRHPRHYEYILRVGSKDLISLNLTDEHTRMTFRFFSIRLSGSENFGAREADAFADLVPYLSTAIAIYARFIQQERQRYLSDATSARLGIGLVELALDGQILSTNTTADSFLHRGRDIFVRHGRLHCTDKQSERNLRHYLDLLKDSPTSEHCEYRFQVPCSDPGGGNWLVMLQRYEIPPEFRDDSADTVSVMIRDSQDRKILSVEQLIELFELTPAEAQLIERLVAGDSLAEAAEKLGRSKSTVRVQLAAVFSKTGVHKQHQLISHVMLAASRLWI